MTEMTARAVLFDMDGVLVDSYEPHWTSWQTTCAARGFDIDRDLFARLFGRTFRAFAEAITGRDLPEAELNAWYAEKEAVYRDSIQRDFPAMPGAPELIRALDDAGWMLAIGSSGPRENVDLVRRRLPEGHRFREAVSGDDLAHSKPHPEVFQKAAARLGLPAERCVVIEDSVHGLQAARAAGARAVGLTGTTDRDALTEEADLVVDTLSDLTPARLSALFAVPARPAPPPTPPPPA